MDSLIQFRKWLFEQIVKNKEAWTVFRPKLDGGGSSERHMESAFSESSDTKMKQNKLDVVWTMLRKFLFIFQRVWWCLLKIFPFSFFSCSLFENHKSNTYKVGVFVA